MHEWRRVKLQEVADEVTVGHVGPMVDEYRSSGIPFLRSQNVLTHRIDLSDIKFIDRHFHSKLKKSALRPGDVVTVRTGKPGTTAVVPESLVEANCSDLVITRPGPVLDAKWLSYYINEAATDYVSAHLVGAVQQHFNVGAAKSMVLHLPPVKEQQAIADVLGAFDDKIAANAGVVTTADALAASLTRSALDLTQQAALKEIALITMGSSPPGTSYNEAGEGTVFYQGVRDFGVRYPANRVWTTEPVRMAKAGDSLLSVRAPVGQLNLSGEDICIGRGLASVRSRVDTPMTLFHLLRDAPEAWAPYEAEGTIFGSINKTQLEGLRLLTVSGELAEGLERQLGAIEASIASALDENVNLAAMRDVLLPKLMSGKIRVKDAEQMVGDVV